jgi:hypothetical protein
MGKEFSLFFERILLHNPQEYDCFSSSIYETVQMRFCNHEELVKQIVEASKNTKVTIIRPNYSNTNCT